MDRKYGMLAKRYGRLKELTTIMQKLRVSMQLSKVRDRDRLRVEGGTETDRGWMEGERQTEGGGGGGGRDGNRQREGGRETEGGGREGEKQKVEGWRERDRDRQRVERGRETESGRERVEGGRETETDIVREGGRETERVVEGERQREWWRDGGRERWIEGGGREREMGRKTLLVLLFFETRQAERDGEKNSTCGGGDVFQDKTGRDRERWGEKLCFCCCFSG